MSNDPILTVISNKLSRLEEGEETSPNRRERAVTLIEGLTWLTKHTWDKYRNKYNLEIANMLKAGIACANILIRAGAVIDQRQKYDKVKQGERTKAAILEKWKISLQKTYDSKHLTLLPVSKM